MSKRIIIKTIVLAFIVFAYNTCMQFISPIIANELAMNQMLNTAYSGVGLQMYTYLTNYSWIVFVVLAVVMFCDEIEDVITKFKGE